MNKELLERINKLNEKIGEVKVKISRVDCMIGSGDVGIRIADNYNNIYLTNEQKIMFFSILRYRLVEELGKLQVEFEGL